MPTLQKHKTRHNAFMPAVDYVGIKKFTMEDFNHLIESLKKYYDMKVDMEGKDFVKIELDQVYDNWRFFYQ